MDAAFPLPVGQDMGQALLDRMDGLTQAVEGVTQTVNDMVERLDQMEGTVNENQAAIANLNRNVDLMLGAVNENRAAIADLTQVAIDNQMAIANLNRNMNLTLGAVNENRAAIANLTQTVIPMSIQVAKTTNRNLGPSETIVPVPNLRGEFPPENLFPHSQDQIAAGMQANHVEELLQFYEVDFPQEMPQRQKTSLLLSQLGMVTFAQAFRN
jgi:hypothetical protein